MHKRLIYFLCFLFLLCVEICIGVFVHDAFIRPYVGDILVTVLLCCLIRALFPCGYPWLPAAVFAFAAAVEFTQLIEIPALNGTLLGIVLGSAFDPADLLCYALGCLLFTAADRICKTIVQ